MRNTSLLLSTFAFVILFSTSCYAYETFTYNNPYFNTYVSGFNVLADYELDVSWNATYHGSSGVALIENNGTGTNTLIAIRTPWFEDTVEETTNSTYVDEALVESGSTWNIILPQYQEGILSFSYLVNETLTTPVPFVAVVNAQTTVVHNITLLNVTPNVWHNYTILIPANQTSYQRLYIYFDFTTDNQPTTIAFNEMRLYTLDINEVRPEFTWTANLTYETINYCGNDSTWVRSSLTGDNNKTGYLWCSDNNDYSVMVARMGNLTYARRVASYENFGNIETGFLLGNADGNFFLLDVVSDTDYNTTCKATQGTAFVEILSLTTIKYTTVCYDETNTYEVIELCTNETANYNYRMCLEYDGSPTAYANLRRLIFNNSDAIRETYTLTDDETLISTQTPSGYNWRFVYNNALKTNWYSFFTGSTIRCETGFTCDPLTNYQYYRDATCNYQQPTYCGEWYCDDSNYQCAFGSIGSFCLGDSISYYTVNASGVTTYGSCFPDYCWQLTNTTIGCYATEEEAEAWNVTTAQENFFGNPAEAVSVTFAGLFGITDVEQANNIFSIFCSLLGSMIITLVIAFIGKSRANMEMLFIVFIVSFIAGLLMFTLAEMLNAFYTTLIIVLTSLSVWAIFNKVGK